MCSSVPVEESHIYVLLHAIREFRDFPPVRGYRGPESLLTTCWLGAGQKAVSIKEQPFHNHFPLCLSTAFRNRVLNYLTQSLIAR